MSSPLQLISHPAAILLQMSGITLGSIMIPVIQARRNASNQAADGERGTALGVESPSVGGIVVRGKHVAKDPPPQPAPTPRQLIRVATQVRRQLSVNSPYPFDAIFMLRQLHMVSQVPHLSLPAPPTPFLRLPTPESLFPEKWIWRLPATTAVNAIMRRLLDPACEERTRAALLPIALKLARHSLHWDTLIWTAVLYSRGQSNALEWERLLARVKGQAGGHGLSEEVGVMTRLDSRPRQIQSDPRMDRWEASLQEKEASRWAEEQTREPRTEGATWSVGRLSDRRRRAETLDPITGRPAPSTLAADAHALDAIPRPVEAQALDPRLHPLSSLPTETLELLFLYLAQQPGRPEEMATQALSISLAMGNLGYQRSNRTLYHTFHLALHHRRQDLAARAWVDWLAQAQRTGRGYRQLSEGFSLLRAKLRDPGKRFSSRPSRTVLSAVATLTRALDRQWARTIDSQLTSERDQRVLLDLLDLLATFPIAPLARDFPTGSERRRLARVHSKVSRMSREVFRRIIETVIGRPVYLGMLKVIIEQTDVRLSTHTSLPLDGYNILITYALRQFHSSEIAVRLVEALRAQGLRPSAATQNILLDLIAQSGKEATALVTQGSPNAHAFPNLVNYLVEREDWDTLEQTVFSLLPELDLASRKPSAEPVADRNSISDPLPTGSGGTAKELPASFAPPLGRSPRLFVALLSALVAAGRVGLAERVFRSARWAAERSRQPVDEVDQTQTPLHSSGPKTPQYTKPWVLPPHAFVLMLNLYAQQVTRGRALEAQGAGHEDPFTSRAYVAGWGRHALRVFGIAEQRRELSSRLGESGIAKTPSSESPRSRIVVDRVRPEWPILRSQAAPIVATWELEGGSKEAELESLSRAMKSFEGRKALATLFPGRQGSEEEAFGGRKRRSRSRKTSMLERRAIQSEADRMRHERRQRSR